jgi:hypothetical protein
MRLANAPKNPLEEDGRKLRPAVCEIVFIFFSGLVVLRGETFAVGAPARSICTSFAVGLLSLTSAQSLTLMELKCSSTLLGARKTLLSVQ